MNIQKIIQPDEAVVNVTFSGQNGELPDPVNFQAGDGDVKGWVAEAIRTGSIPGLHAAGNVNLGDYVVDRFPATEARPYNLIQVRPKTAFGR